LKVWCVMSSSAVVPRGTALTPTMEFTGPDGVAWSAYIEGAPPVRQRRWLRQTLLPARRIRFDSAAESRVTATVPAGSPFLPERRLLAMLAGSTSLPERQPGADRLVVGLPRLDRVRAAIAAMRAWGLNLAGGVHRIGRRVRSRLAEDLRGLPLLHHR